MKVKAIKASYVGDSEEASEQDIRERVNRAFVCTFFKRGFTDLTLFAKKGSYPTP